MGQEKLVAEIAQALGLNFSEETISTMLQLLEDGISPDNMVRMLEDIKAEINGMSAWKPARIQ